MWLQFHTPVSQHDDMRENEARCHFGHYEQFVGNRDQTTYWQNVVTVALCSINESINYDWRFDVMIANVLYGCLWAPVAVYLNEDHSHLILHVALKQALVNYYTPLNALTMFRSVFFSIEACCAYRVLQFLHHT